MCDTYLLLSSTSDDLKYDSRICHIVITGGSRVRVVSTSEISRTVEEEERCGGGVVCVCHWEV